MVNTVDIRSRKWAFIVNPVAGAGYAASYEPEVRRKAAENGLDAEFFRTEGPGHARKLAADLVSRGTEVIAIVGGDGTMSEAAQGMAGSDAILVPISAGTGNDFVTITGFSEHFSEMDWEALMRGEIARMDLGVCNGRRFINGMGFGFDAAVAAANYSEDGAVKQGGKNKYFMHILVNLLFYREGLIRYLPDGRIEGKNGRSRDFSDYAFLNTIALGRRMAGGFHLTPDALADDGLLDFCRIERLSVPERLRYMAAVMKKKHMGLPKTHMSRLENLTVEFGREAPYHVDGELFYAVHLDIGIEKGALRIAIDPSRTDAFDSGSRKRLTQ